MEDSNYNEPIPKQSSSWVSEETFLQETTTSWESKEKFLRNDITKYQSAKISNSVRKIANQISELVEVCRAGFSKEERANEDNEIFFDFIARKSERFLCESDLTNFQAEVHSLLNTYILQQVEESAIILNQQE